MKRRFGTGPVQTAPGEKIVGYDYPRKIALFIDGANFYVAQKIVGLNIDWKRLLQYYSTQGDMLRVFFYTGILPVEEGEVDRMRPVYDWMAYNGFVMRTKMAKRFIDPVTKRETTKGNMDIEICLDMIDTSPHVTDVYLFSGDGDFLPLVKRIQLEGVRVHIVSTIVEKKDMSGATVLNRMCADELRRQCDSFTELADIAKHLRRDQDGQDEQPSHRR